jgi:formate dehydrogenase alpha subunit
MNRQNALVTVNIDNKTYRVQRGQTILKAATQNNIYIPTLCAHADLSPYGGCRMCIVEVEGMRNFPTACTTPVEDGMVIRTHTTQIQAVRTEILQLFMSEHPSSCLICDEKNECKLYSDTIHKAGITTGCRYCPNDGQCELQDVVEYLGVKEINYPIFYRNQRVEKEDPFYDRDYNLCILCGRCIRMCQEVRLANVLAFKNRGRDTLIGPAYGRTHFEAGCEFCGACVSVCPTGTLSEKARKWDGKPEREQITTCSFCGVGCQMRLLVKGERIIGSLPLDDPLVNQGQLCVKGRFCIPELVNGYKRLKKPYKTAYGTFVEIPWGQAIETAARQLLNCPPEEFGMLISPNCSNEDLYIAQKFTRVIMGSHNIDCSARSFYGAGFNNYLNLMRRAVPLSFIQNASVILCIGLDTRFGRSVVGVELRRALKKEAKIITINPRDHNISLTAEKWIRPFPGNEINVLRSLVALTSGKSTVSTQRETMRKIEGLGEDIYASAQLLKNARPIVILLGSEFMQYSDSPSILKAIEQLAQNIDAGVLPLPSQNNLFGSILMGAYPELLPGGYSSTNLKSMNELKKKWDNDTIKVCVHRQAETFISGKKMKVLYLIGEMIPNNKYLPAEFVISQNIYSPDELLEANLLLPAASFTETDGTFINGEGRVQRINKAVNPPGEARPDWKILCKIAQKMGIKGFDFRSSKEIHHEISKLVRQFGDFDHPKREAAALKCTGEFIIPKTKFSVMKSSTKKFPFLLSTSVTEHTHRGMPLSHWVEGAKKVFSEGTLEISPQDAGKAGIEEGNKVEVTSTQFKKIWPAKIASDLAPGMLHVTLPLGESMNPNPHPVRIRKKYV